MGQGQVLVPPAASASTETVLEPEFVVRQGKLVRLPKLATAAPTPTAPAQGPSNGPVSVPPVVLPLSGASASANDQPARPAQAADSAAAPATSAGGALSHQWRNIAAIAKSQLWTLGVALLKVVGT